MLQRNPERKVASIRTLKQDVCPTTISFLDALTDLLKSRFIRHFQGANFMPLRDTSSGRDHVPATRSLSCLICQAKTSLSLIYFNIMNSCILKKSLKSFITTAVPILRTVAKTIFNFSDMGRTFRNSLTRPLKVASTAARPPSRW